MINILVIGTNAYAPLALRLMTRWRQFYRGREPYAFWYFGDVNPSRYGIEAEYIHTTHASWKDATNSKFAAVAHVNGKLEPSDNHWLLYIDADTNIWDAFCPDRWLVNGLVVAKHWNHVRTPKEKLPLDRNTCSRCYVPYDQETQEYYYGAFWGGERAAVVEMAAECNERMQADLAGGYDAAVNDESYTNWYFLKYAHKVKHKIESRDFPFAISCKGGLDTRKHNGLDVNPLLKEIEACNGAFFNIASGKVVCGA
jgi:hypothetical protein